MSIYGNTIMVGSASGGGAKQMFQVKLPPSIYYESASEWVEQTADQPQGNGCQLVVNGKLWVIPGNGTAYAIDLNTGNIVDNFSDGNLSFSMDSCAFCSDDSRRIWISKPVAVGERSRLCVTHLIQIDVVEKTVTDLGECCVNNSLTEKPYQDRVSGMWSSPIIYSRKYDGVFVFGNWGFADYGGNSDINYQGANSAGAFYSLLESSFSRLPTIPRSQVYGFAWEDVGTGDIYVGGGVTFSAKKSVRQTIRDRNTTIYRYTKSTSTFSTVVSNFKPVSGVDNNTGGWFTLGDTIILVGQNVCLPFDPKTGETRPGAVPTNPGIPVYFWYSGAYQNILYISGSEKFIKCALYEELPANAPIVAKIYKGNKYHSTVPFSIPGKLEVKTTQQIADSDIEIKMYEYDAAGGQTLYIET